MTSLMENFRQYVVGTETNVPIENGTFVKSINFDNAATTPPLYQVVSDLNQFTEWYSSVHRGKGYKSTYCSDVFENARDVVKNFIGADKQKDNVVFTKGTTESINILAHCLKEQDDRRDIVISTWMEHAANDLPWRSRFYVEYADIDSQGRLLLEDVERKLQKYRGRVKLLAVTGASNVTGYINPVSELAKLAHRYGTEIFVDGAQLIPHMSFDMKPWGADEHIDYTAFSAHKMYAPYGCGVLVGPQKSFEKGAPYCTGGGAINLITHKRVAWDPCPSKNEAGSPNLMGVVALVSAINTLKYIGMGKIYEHEKKLLEYACGYLNNVTDIKRYCDYSPGQNKIGVILMNIEGISHGTVAAILSKEAGIAVRNGFFCAHPYCERLLGLKEKDMDYYFTNPEKPRPGMIRVSFGIYNDFSEIDRFVQALEFIARNKAFYIDKYTRRGAEFGVLDNV